MGVLLYWCGVEIVFFNVKRQHRIFNPQYKCTMGYVPHSMAGSVMKSLKSINDTISQINIGLIQSRFADKSEPTGNAAETRAQNAQMPQLKN